MSESDAAFEREQEQAAAEQAGAIGGRASSEESALASEAKQDPAQIPLSEAGQGEAEGFELAEQELVEHASHGDLHAARRVLEDAPDQDEDARAAPSAPGDAEASSQRPDD